MYLPSYQTAAMLRSITAAQSAFYCHLQLLRTTAIMPTTRRGAGSHPNRGRIEKPQRRGRPEKRTEPKPRRGTNPKRGGTPRPRSRRSSTAVVQQQEQQFEPVPEGTTKVPRVYNELWASTPLSLSFVEHGQLDTSPDTEVMALNLIDHIIKEENWNPALSQNKLCAACFFFASKMTGRKNAAEDIAASFEVGAEIYASAMLSTINEPRYADDYTVRYRIAQALKMNAGDVEWGYRILWEQRASLEEFVGEYAEALEKLPLPVGVEAPKGNEEPALDAVMEDVQQETRAAVDVKAAEAKAEELMKVVEQPLLSAGDFELDEFEASVAEYE